MEPVAQQAGSANGRSLVHAAAAARNASGGSRTRRNRWRHARDVLWSLLDQHVGAEARVAIVGAGNGDDLPLRRISRRAAHLDLIDLDAAALRRARRRVPLARHVHTIVGDVTAGAAEAIVRRAQGERGPVAMPPPTPVGNGPYDVVVADLMLTQLLFPALADSGLRGAEIDKVLLDHGQGLTDRVIARLHSTAPDGLVVHVHDVLGWWENHTQPFTLDDVLALAKTDPAAARTLAQRGNTPHGCDPWMASRSLGAKLTPTTFWRWPFAPGTDYLVSATVARTSASKNSAVSS